MEYVRLCIKGPFKCWLRAKGLVPSQGGKSLSQSPRLSMLGKHCPKISWTIARSMIWKWSVEVARNLLNNVRAKSLRPRFFVNSMGYSTVSGYDHGPKSWSWRCHRHIEDGKAREHNTMGLRAPPRDVVLFRGQKKWSWSLMGLPILCFLSYLI